MAVPSISVQRAWKVSTMRCFWSAVQMNWSPLTTRPSKMPMPGAASRQAAMAALRRAGSAGKDLRPLGVPIWGMTPGS